MNATDECDGARKMTVTVGSDSQPGLRVPRNLHQVDDNSCLSCVAANLLYLFGVVERPDPHWVDRQVGRVPGREAQRSAVRRFLLQQGLSLHRVCAYRPERFVQEGIGYLRSYYHQEWDSSWDAYWTPEQLARNRRECLATLELNAYGDRMRTEYREPALADILTVLDRGGVAWISIDNYRGEVACHAVLVYARKRNVFRVYSPELSGNCLRRYRRRRLERVWLRSEGMTAVWAR